MKRALLATLIALAAAPASAQFLNPPPSTFPGPPVVHAPSSTFGDPARGPVIAPPLGKQTPYAPPPDVPLPNICCNGVRPPSLAIPPFPY